MKKFIGMVFLTILSLVLLPGDTFAYEQLPLGTSEAYDTILSENIINEAIGGENTQVSLRTILSRNFISLVNIIIGSLGILFLVVTGIKMVFNQGSEDQATRYRKEFLWVFVGLAIMSGAEFIAFEVFDPVDPNGNGERDIFTGSESLAAFSTLAYEIKRYFQYIVVGFILIQGAVTGYNLALASGSNDEDLENEKKFLTSVVFGVLLILLAEILVAVFSLGGTEADTMNPGAGIEAANVVVDQVVGIINYLLTLFGILGVLMLVWAAVYYVTSFGNEDQMKRAKQIIITAVVGLIVIVSSFTLMNFFFL